MKPEIKRTADGKEQRIFSGSMELRAAENKFEISGTAVGYNVRSSLIGGQFYEVVAPGAFSDTLRAEDQVCCFNHDANQILGRKKSGTLQLEDSAAGLKFRCTLDRSNPVHQSVYASIRRGDVDGCSFQFQVPDGGDSWEENGGTILRTLKRVKLFECGPCLFPAYPLATSVGARAEQRSHYVLGADWRTGVLKRLHELDGQFFAQQDAHRRSMCELIGREITAEEK